MTRLLFFASALVGPMRNPDQAIPWQDKVHALVRFARSGETRECEKVLIAIRTYKADAEATLPIYVQAKKQLENGIRNDKEFLKGARTAAERASLQRTLDSHRHTLSIVEWKESG